MARRLRRFGVRFWAGDGFPTSAERGEDTGVEEWRDGKRLLAALDDSLLTVIDVDPRNGGEASWSVIRELVTPLVVCQASTPGGGHHYYVPRLGIGTRKMADLPGIDVVEGHPSVFVAPTTRHDRNYGGRGYRWVIDVPESVPGTLMTVERGVLRARLSAASGASRASSNGSSGGGVGGSGSGGGTVPIERYLVYGIESGSQRGELLRVAGRLARLGKDLDEIVDVLGSIVLACRRRGLEDASRPWSGGDVMRLASEAVREISDDGGPIIERNGDGGAVADWMREYADWLQGADSVVTFDKKGSPVTTGEGEPRSDIEQITGEKVSRVKITWASDIEVLPVSWLWEGRVAMGTLSLLTGREGVGKSTLMYQLAADITRGTLPGALFGQKRRVFVCATEDGWEHVINPRLIAAGADRTLIGRVEVKAPGEDGFTEGLVLPRDCVELAQTIEEYDVACLLLDPLIARLDGALNSHKDADVRRALEPLTKMADKTGCSVIGMIHVNKSGKTDPMDLVMASRAFTAVARAVTYVIRDEEDESQRFVGTPKNNLGRTDLPSLIFTLVDQLVDRVMSDVTGELTDVRAGRLEWRGEDPRSIGDILVDQGGNGGGGGDGHARGRDGAGSLAEIWLNQYMTAQELGGDSWVLATEAIDAGTAANHAERTLKRARSSLGIVSVRRGGGRGTAPVTWWALEGTDPATAPGSGGTFSQTG